MNKSIKKTELRETQTDYQIIEIPGTDFVKWYAQRTLTVNSSVVSVEDFCGVNHKSFIDNLDENNDIPDSVISIDAFANKEWKAVAVKKEDMNDVRGGKKSIDSVIKSIRPSNIDSDEYELYLYGTFFEQLIGFDMQLVDIPIRLRLKRNSKFRVCGCLWSDVKDAINEFKKSPVGDGYEIISVDIDENIEEATLFVRLEPFLRNEYEKSNNFRNRINFFLRYLWEIPEADKKGK